MTGPGPGPPGRLAGRLPRLGEALIATAEAVAFARGQASDLPDRPEAWRWVSIALTMALQGACIAALLAYDTADPADILAPEDRASGATPPKLAPVALLLRRVTSSTHLADPDRLPFTASRKQSVLDFVAYRNAAAHILPLSTVPGPEELPRLAEAVIDALTHLCVTHPAFDPVVHPAPVKSLSDDLSGLAGMMAKLP